MGETWSGSSTGSPIWEEVRRIHSALAAYKLAPSDETWLVFAQLCEELYGYLDLILAVGIVRTDLITGARASLAHLVDRVFDAHGV